MGFIELTAYEEGGWMPNGGEDFNCIGKVPVNISIIGKVTVYRPHRWGSDLTLIKHAYTNGKLMYVKETPEEISRLIKEQSKISELESRLIKLEDKMFSNKN
mgnify:CR=1 FL=1